MSKPEIITTTTETTTITIGRNGVTIRGDAPEKDNSPLTDNERDVYELLLGLSAGEALTAKQISKDTGILETTIRTHIIPKLKKRYPVKNRRGGVGYYLSAH
jgi:hypothetical protein